MSTVVRRLSPYCRVVVRSREAHTSLHARETVPYVKRDAIDQPRNEEACYEDDICPNWVDVPRQALLPL